MNPKVYIETSIPSFYYEVRSDPDMVARREWTREWWNNASDNYRLVTSVAVLDELNRGRFPGKIEAVEMISSLLFVSIKPAIAEIVEVYIQQHLMPKDPVGDALHLALASYHKCDFLLTWNCRHDRKCEQVCSYSTSERYAWTIRSNASHTIRVNRSAK